jgi:hypothetical protein
MTVGQALAAKTGYKMLHNHMTIEPVLELFDFDDPPFWPIVQELRRVLLREAAKSELPGLICTFVWAFNQPKDRVQIDEFSTIVKDTGGDVAYVELNAGLSVRLERNKSEHRLHHKPSKRDVEKSETFLLEADKSRVFATSDEYPIPNPDRWLKLDNTKLSPDDAAERIIEAFNLPT